MPWGRSCSIVLAAGAAGGGGVGQKLWYRSGGGGSGRGGRGFGCCGAAVPISCQRLGQRAEEAVGQKLSYRASGGAAGGGYLVSSDESFNCSSSCSCTQSANTMPAILEK